MLRPFHIAPEVLYRVLEEQEDRNQSKAGLEEVSWGLEGRSVEVTPLLGHTHEVQ